MEIPHVGCASHRLALDAKLMLEDLELGDAIENVRTMILKCKTRIKNRGMLSRLTNLAPVCPLEQGGPEYTT